MTDGVADKRSAADHGGADGHDLQRVIDLMPAMAWSARTDGTGDFFNQHYLDYVGLSVEEVRDWQWTMGVHPDDRSRLLETWTEFRDAGKGGEVEARIRRHDGVYRWFLFRTSPQFDERGRVVQWLGVNIDIDDQKRSAMMLAGEMRVLERIASGEPLREILAGLCEMIESVDADCCCEIRILDAAGAKILYSVAPRLPAEYSAAIEKMPLDDESRSVDGYADPKAEMIADDIVSHPRWLDAEARSHLAAHKLRSVWQMPIFTRQGEFLGTLFVYRQGPAKPLARHRDIIARAVQIASIAVARSRTEEELGARQRKLNEAHEHLSQAQSLTKTGSFRTDVLADTHVQSDELHRILECKPTTLREFRERIHKEDVAAFEADFKRAMADQTDFDAVFRFVTPKGNVRHVHAVAHFQAGNPHRPIVMGSIQDITEAVEREDELNALRTELAHLARSMSLGELAASIAHEVNQPLAGIVNNANACIRMLSVSPPNIDGAVRTAERSIRDGNRAAEVVRRLRVMFRKRQYAAEPVDLNDAVSEIIAICAHDMQRRRIALRFDRQSELPEVIGDRVQLQQVILNLILNAADAIAGNENRPKSISVTGRVTAEGGAAISVKDDGAGVGDEPDRIFEAFYTTKAEGMGIGLSVSKSIVERHKGRIWFEENQGPGVTFTFSLPGIAAA